MNEVRPLTFASRNKAIGIALLKGASLSEMRAESGLSVRRCAEVMQQLLSRVAPDLRALSLPEVRATGRVEELCGLISQIPDGGPSPKKLPKFAKDNQILNAFGNKKLEPTHNQKIQSALERRIAAAGRQDFSAPLDKEDLIRAIDKKTRTAFFFLDDITMAGMAGRDLIAVINTLLTQRQLAAGEPTHILTHAERAKMDELLPMVIKECERRGIVIDAVKTEYRLEGPGEAATSGGMT